MFVVYKSTVARKFGSRRIEICCEKCQAEYTYDLRRMSSGRALGGSDESLHVSMARAEEKLQNDLTNHPELVPCPSCNWIDTNSVELYRQYQVAYLGGAGMMLSLLVIPLSVIYAFVSGAGYAASYRPYAMEFLYIPTGMLILTAVGFWRDEIMKRRFAPNRNFPLPPRVPAGTPTPVLIKSPAANIAVRSGVSTNYSTISIIKFAPGKDILPAVCCGCMKQTQDSELLNLDGVARVMVPVCKACQSASSRKFAIRFLVSVFAIGLFLFSLHRFNFWTGPVTFWHIFGVCVVSTVLAVWRIPNYVRLVGFDEVRGVATIEMMHPLFERAYNEFNQNAHKIELRRDYELRQPVSAIDHC